MPHMKVHESGGIIFVPTKQEREVMDLKNTLKQSIEDVQKLKEELLKLTSELRGD